MKRVSYTVELQLELSKAILVKIRWIEVHSGTTVRIVWQIALCRLAATLPSGGRNQCKQKA